MYKGNVADHEIGHILGLGHEEGTFMNPEEGGGTRIIDKQRQLLFNGYGNTNNDSFRNSNRTNLGSGNSKAEFQLKLRNWNVDYDFSKL